MALTLTCSCGANFEVEDTFAGQTVTCPECQSSIKAPALQRGPVRTSGFAIASLVLALIGAFTVVGTLAAVLCGIIALVRIARHSERMAGAGFAIFGIILGLLFTALTLFSYIQGELFAVGSQLRQFELKSNLDFPENLEIVQTKNGFKIERPSADWGVARAEFKDNTDRECALMLINPKEDAWATVTVNSGWWQSAESLRQSIVKAFQDEEKNNDPENGKLDLRQVTNLKVRQERRLPNRDGAEVAEVVLDVKIAGQSLTYLIQVVKEPRTNQAYQVRTWTTRRRFAQLEPELRRLLESFHPLEGR